jgi:hypothetical protein
MAKHAATKQFGAPEIKKSNGQGRQLASSGLNGLSRKPENQKCSREPSGAFLFGPVSQRVSQPAPSVGCSRNPSGRGSWGTTEVVFLQVQTDFPPLRLAIFESGPCGGPADITDPFGGGYKMPLPGAKRFTSPLS